MQEPLFPSLRIGTVLPIIAGSAAATGLPAGIYRYRPRKARYAAWNARLQAVALGLGSMVGRPR